MRVRTATDLGQLIRDRRKTLGLDQKTLAEKARVGRQWIVAVEKGKPRAEVGLLFQTLDALGLRVLVDAGEPTRPNRSVPDIDLDAIIERHRGHGP